MININTQRKGTMENGRLKKIASELDLTTGDIQAIEKERFREKWLYPITGGIVAVISTIAGYLLGKDAEPRESGYLFSLAGASNVLGFSLGIPLSFLPLMVTAPAFQTPSSMNQRKVRNLTIILTVLFTIVGFLVAYHLARPVGSSTNNFGEASDYGVYSGDENGGNVK